MVVVALLDKADETPPWRSLAAKDVDADGVVAVAVQDGAGLGSLDMGALAAPPKL